MIPTVRSHRSHQGLVSTVRAVLAVAALAALAIPTRSLAQAPTFNALVTSPTNSSFNFPGAAAVGDYNGDGKLDALVTDGSTDFRLMLGTGTGTFTETNVNAPGTNPGQVRAADLNGDGKLDAVAVSNGGNFAVTVLLNTGGSPQFTITNYFTGLNQLRSVTVGDLNGDGKLDLVVGNALASVVVFLNNGGGTFSLGQFTSLLPGGGGPSVGPGVITDLNGDGKADYVVASNQNHATNVFFGNGNGTLQTPVIIPSFGFALAVADVNHDGKPDLIETDPGSSDPSSQKLMVFLNNGGGTFSTPALYPTGGLTPLSVATTDINGDGHLDAVVGNTDSNNAAVLLGNGSGAFGAATVFPVNQKPRDVSVGDFNGDGKPDIATVGTNDRTFGVRLNTTVPALPTQTLTILGASGNIGDVAANVEYYNPATGNWQPAYVANYAPYGHPVTHPWGNVAGTNHWVNYRTDGASDPRPPFDTSTYWYLYRVRIIVPADAQNAKMTFSLKADNRAQVAINGVSTGPEIVGQANGVNADAVFSQNLHPGENTITLNVGDEGGLNGFNFRLDLSVQSSQPLEIVPTNDTTPPVITAPADITREATSAAGAVVTFTATAVDAVSGPVAVVASPASGSIFPIATTPVGLAATDAAGNDATASFIVTVQDTIAPAVTVPANVTAEATGASGATVSYPAATATDAVGVTALTYTAASGSTFPLGTTTVIVTAKDAAGHITNGSFTITVVDTTAPAIASVTRSSATLWPPNHQMVPITVSAVVSDAVGSSLKIVNVISNEPDNGLGDGDTAKDIQITGNLTVNLRAERSGKGNGRIYTITLEARDAAGNTSQATCTVSVPKSQGGK